MKSKYKLDQMIYCVEPRPGLVNLQRGTIIEIIPPDNIYNGYIYKIQVNENKESYVREIDCSDNAEYIVDAMNDFLGEDLYA